MRSASPNSVLSTSTMQTLIPLVHAWYVCVYSCRHVYTQSAGHTCSCHFRYGYLPSDRTVGIIEFDPCSRIGLHPSVDIASRFRLCVSV